MTEEVKQTEVKTEVVVEDKEAATLKKAVDMGYNPDWDGPEDEKLSPKEFINRAPLFEKIGDLSKRAKEAERIVFTVYEQQRQAKLEAEKAGYERALKELKEQKKEAIKEDNLDLVVETDDKIADLKAKKVREELKQEQKPAVQIDPEYYQWAEKNTWFSPQNAEMYEDAQIYHAKFVQMYPKESAVDLLNRVTKRIQKEYPDKFKNPNRDRPSSTDGGSSRDAKGNSPGEKEAVTLEEDAQLAKREIMKIFKWSEEQYNKKYKDLHSKRKSA